MMPVYAFRQLDVFSTKATMGNALAVVHDADALDDGQMAAFARWTNLSETAFLLKPSLPGADYRVRIFTPLQELPFAGHPTLGSCHAWLENGGMPIGKDIVQQCAAGLITIRRRSQTLFFAAPPLVRMGPIEADILQQALRGTGLRPDQIAASAWVDNGPGWMGLLLDSRKDVLEVKPDFAQLKGLRVGLVAPTDPERDATDADFEVRAFTAAGFEDAATGSLNAGLALWLIGSDRAPETYVAAQGTVIGRQARLHVAKEGETVWIGGAAQTLIKGSVAL